MSPEYMSFVKINARQNMLCSPSKAMCFRAPYTSEDTNCCSRIVPPLRAVLDEISNSPVMMKLDPSMLIAPTKRQIGHMTEGYDEHYV